MELEENPYQTPPLAGCLLLVVFCLLITTVLCLECYDKADLEPVTFEVDSVSVYDSTYDSKTIIVKM